MANLFNSNPLMGLGLALSTFGGQESLGGAINLLNYAQRQQLIDEERRREESKENNAAAYLRNSGNFNLGEGQAQTRPVSIAERVFNGFGDQTDTNQVDLMNAVGAENLLNTKIAGPKVGFGKPGDVPYDLLTGKPIGAAIPGGDDLTPWQKSQIENQNRRFDLQDAAQAAAAARAAAAEEARNRPQATAYVNRSTGNPVRFKPDLGVYVDEDKTVSGADLVPAADFNKDVEAARTIVGDLANANAVGALVKNNPGAFKESKVNEARIKRAIPFKGEQLANAVFTPEENAVRARVAQDSAVILNKLYGAALSLGENIRAASFAPNPDDTIEQLLPKVEAAKAWANSKKTSLLPSAIKAAERQLNAPPPEQSGALRVGETATIGGLKVTRKN